MNKLPNECLTQILENLTLSDQIRYRQINHQWQAILTRLIQKRKSLKIFSSYQQQQYYCRELIYLNLHDQPELLLYPTVTSSGNNSYQQDDIVLESRQFSRSLAQLFASHLLPEVNHLTVYFNSDASQPELETFLQEKISNQINHLTLVGHIQPKHIQKLKLRLNWILKYLSGNLVKLDLLFKQQLPPPAVWLDPVECQIFYQRHQCYALDDLIPQILGKFSGKINLKQLNLNWTSTHSLVKLLNQKSTQQSTSLGYLSNLQKLRISPIEFNSTRNQIEKISQNFPNLTYLDLEFVNWPLLSTLTGSLDKLDQLNELRLSFIRIDHLDLNEHEISRDPIPIRKLQQIKKLFLREPNRLNSKLSSEEIQLKQFTHFDYQLNEFSGHKFCQTLSRIFPNLQQLSIRINSYYEIEIKNAIQKYLPIWLPEVVKGKFNFYGKLNYKNIFTQHRQKKLDSITATTTTAITTI